MLHTPILNNNFDKSAILSLYADFFIWPLSTIWPITSVKLDIIIKKFYYK